MTYGYARCSTNEAQQDIDRQIRELKLLGVDKANIYFEYESGAKTDRIQFERLLAVVQEGDTIATTEVSRLTRSTKQLCEIVELVQSKKLKLIAGSLTVDCTKDKLDPMTDCMLKVMGVFAELERNMASQRIKSGMVNAKDKGVVLGRPATTAANLPPLFIKYYPLYVAKQVTQEGLADLCKITRQSVSKYIKIYKESTA